MPINTLNKKSKILSSNPPATNHSNNQKLSSCASTEKSNDGPTDRISINIQSNKNSKFLPNSISATSHSNSSQLATNHSNNQRKCSHYQTEKS